MACALFGALVGAQVAVPVINGFIASSHSAAAADASDPEGAGATHEVVFEFQQGGSGSAVKRRSQSFGEGTSGKAAFSVIGDDYFKRGKVLAWKISLLRDGVAIDSRQSYLWR